MESTEDNSRYLYTLATKDKPMSEEGGDGSENARYYKRYKLADHKDFDSLFFPEKENLLKLLSNFEEKRGKYSIKGELFLECFFGTYLNRL